MKRANAKKKFRDFDERQKSENVGVKRTAKWKRYQMHQTYNKRVTRWCDILHISFFGSLSIWNKKMYARSCHLCLTRRLHTLSPRVTRFVVTPSTNDTLSHLVHCSHVRRLSINWHVRIHFFTHKNTPFSLAFSLDSFALCDFAFNDILNGINGSVVAPPHQRHNRCNRIRAKKKRTRLKHLCLI